MSLYANYIKERENKEIIETPEGFATYKIFENGECYLQDIYILPEFRNSGLATSFADQVCMKAKLAGCSVLIGSVSIDDQNVTRNLKIFLAYGMDVYKIIGSMIFLRKNLGE